MYRVKLLGEIGPEQVWIGALEQERRVLPRGLMRAHLAEGCRECFDLVGKLGGVCDLAPVEVLVLERAMERQTALLVSSEKPGPGVCGGAAHRPT